MIEVRIGQHSQFPFDPRNSPTSPIMIATTPPTSIHMALSVGEPVKNREMSELKDFDAATPKIVRRIPPARIASETALFMEKSSVRFSYQAPQKGHRSFGPRKILSKMITIAMATGTFFKFGPRRVFLLGFLGNQGFGSIAAARLHPGKDNGLLFLHVQIILYGFDPLDATGDFTRLIDGLLGINEAGQLHDALVGFHTDLE